MKKIPKCSLAFPAAIVALGLHGAIAQAAMQSQVEPAGLVIEDVGAGERINFAGKLRMLSQRISASACYYVNGVGGDGSRSALTTSTAEFEKIVKALQYGDESIGIIGPEERRKTLVQIEKLQAVWGPIKTASEAILEGDDHQANILHIAENNMPLLDEAKLLVSEIVGQYSNPAEMLQSDAMLIDISGRQRMLTQKMSKESCGISTKINAMGSADALTGTMNMFETSLIALKDGFPNAGINPPPTDEIQAGLDVVYEDWTTAKAKLETVVAGGQLSVDQMNAIFDGLNVTLKDMNDVVMLYTAAAKSAI
ncbi:type IV pili methyl-accepting chemotaxis transducer N-terminal domain-containing protein [Litoreibacter roseus]|uniref:NarX-like N-terminal domain-containing protein n=1 Tax=Litoreibacter roseus TaxID=2601869 RepID=A0A6N6JE13_9RHOB|nr:type IV pili methyl-accepting chemotaxis transducer N-terminal domain-containing protein [Litoreibacter roseus]GFE64446.1 hypothetical protein KIN_15200 [Litoreibacter roseus]